MGAPETPSAAQVAGPTTPSTSRPWAAWKWRTAVSVAGPNSPSAETCSASCRRRVAAPGERWTGPFVEPAWPRARPDLSARLPLPAGGAIRGHGAVGGGVPFRHRQRGGGRGQFGLAVRAERLPGGGSGDPVDRKPVGGLEATDRTLGFRAEFAVDGDVQRGLQALHRVGRDRSRVTLACGEHPFRPARCFGCGVFPARACGTHADARSAGGFFAGAGRIRFPGRSVGRVFEDRRVW